MSFVFREVARSPAPTTLAAQVALSALSRCPHGFRRLLSSPATHGAVAKQSRHQKAVAKHICHEEPVLAPLEANLLSKCI